MRLEQFAHTSAQRGVSFAGTVEVLLPLLGRQVLDGVQKDRPGVVDRLVHCRAAVGWKARL
jgi:hypothetical protein